MRTKPNLNPGPISKFISNSLFFILLFPVLVTSGQAPVVQTSDSAIQRINLYPVDSVIGFHNTYRLDSDLSGGQRYPTFEQPGPGGEIWSYDVIMYKGHSKEEGAWNNSKCARTKKLKAERVPFLPLSAIPLGSLKGPLRQRMKGINLFVFFSLFFSSSLLARFLLPFISQSLSVFLISEVLKMEYKRALIKENKEQAFQKKIEGKNSYKIYANKS